MAPGHAEERHICLQVSRVSPVYSFRCFRIRQTPPSPSLVCRASAGFHLPGSCLLYWPSLSISLFPLLFSLLSACLLCMMLCLTG